MDHARCGLLQHRNFTNCSMGFLVFEGRSVSGYDDPSSHVDGDRMQTLCKPMTDEVPSDQWCSVKTF